MIRLICVAIAVMAMGNVNAQKNLLDSAQDYRDGICSNFEKLGVEWILDPTARHSMDNGLNLLRAGDWGSAMKFFNELIEIDSSFIPAYHFRYRCYERALLSLSAKPIDVKKANSDFVHLKSKLQNSDLQTFLDLWDSYLPNKEFRRMVTPILEIAPPFFLLSTYLKDHQRDVNAESFNLLRKSASSLLSGKPADALVLNNKALSLDSSACGLYMKAVIVQLMGQHDSAFYFFSKCLNRDERIIEARENLALYEHQLQNKAAVFMHLSSLDKFKPNSPAISRFCGLLKMQIDDYPGAIHDWSKILKVDPLNYYSLKQRAFCYFQARDYHASLKDLNTAVKIVNDDLDTYFQQSENYLRLGDSTQCIKVLQDAGQIFTRDARLDLFTADKLVEVGRTGAAQGKLSQVMAFIHLNNSGDKFSHLANTIQCKIYLRKGNVDKALKKLDAFIKNDGEQIDYLFLRAKIFILKGEKEKAKADLKKLVNADFEPAIALLDSL